MNLTASWPYIENVARTRLQNNRGRWHVSEYGEQIETLGAAGELAARRFLGLPEKLHSKMDGGVDFYYNGLKVDVKTTHWTPRADMRYLQWRKGKPLKCDILLFVVVDMNTMQAVPVGWATKEDVLRAPINETRDYPCHEIAVSDLRPLWRLTLGKR